MNKLSLKEKLIIFATGKSPNWINSGDFQRLAINEGYLGSNAARRLYDLSKSGIFEQRLTNGVAEYRLAETRRIPVAGTVDSKTETVHFRPDYIRQQKLNSARLI